MHLHLATVCVGRISRDVFGEKIEVCAKTRETGIVSFARQRASPSLDTRRTIFRPNGRSTRFTYLPVRQIRRLFCRSLNWKPRPNLSRRSPKGRDRALRAVPRRAVLRVVPAAVRTSAAKFLRRPSSGLRWKLIGNFLPMRFYFFFLS